MDRCLNNKSEPISSFDCSSFDLRPYRFERFLSARWSFVVLAFVAFFVGPRQAYSVFDVANFGVGTMVVIGIGPRYWGGTSWT